MRYPFTVNNLELAIYRDIGCDFLAERRRVVMMKCASVASVLLCAALTSMWLFSFSLYYKYAHTPSLGLWIALGNCGCYVGTVLTLSLAIFLIVRLLSMDEAVKAVKQKAVCHIEGDSLMLPEYVKKEILANSRAALRICEECYDLHRKLGCDYDPTKLFKLIVQLVVRSYMQSADEGYLACFPILAAIKVRTGYGMQTCCYAACDAIIGAEYSDRSPDLKRKLLLAVVAVNHRCDDWSNIHAPVLRVVACGKPLCAQLLIECDDLLRDLGYEGLLIYRPKDVRECMGSLVMELRSGNNDALIERHALCFRNMVRRALPGTIYESLKRNLGCYATTVLALIILAEEEWKVDAQCCRLLDSRFMQFFAHEDYCVRIMLQQPVPDQEQQVSLAMLRMARDLKSVLEGHYACGIRQVLKAVPDEIILQITSDLLEYSVAGFCDNMTQRFANVLLVQFLLRAVSGIQIKEWDSARSDIENVVFFVFYNLYLNDIYSVYSVYGHGGAPIYFQWSLNYLESQSFLSDIGTPTSRTNWITRNAYPLALALELMCKSADPKLRERCVLLLESFPAERNTDTSLKQLICQHFPELKAHFHYEDASDYEQRPMSLQQMVVRSIRETYATICQDSRNITLDEFIDTMADKAGYPKVLREMIGPNPGAECLLDPTRAMLALKKALQPFLYPIKEEPPSIGLISVVSTTDVAREDNAVGVTT